MSREEATEYHVRLVKRLTSHGFTSEQAEIRLREDEPIRHSNDYTSLATVRRAKGEVVEPVWNDGPWNDRFASHLLAEVGDIVSVRNVDGEVIVTALDVERGYLRFKETWGYSNSDSLPPPAPDYRGPGVSSFCPVFIRSRYRYASGDASTFSGSYLV